MGHHNANGRGAAADADAVRDDAKKNAQAPPPDALSAAAAATRPTFRHARYAPLDHVWADTATAALYPRPPAECGPVVCPVLISRSHSLPYLECLRHLRARGYRVLIQTDSRNIDWVRRAYGSGSSGGGGGDGKNDEDDDDDDGKNDDASPSSSGAFEVELVPDSITGPLWADFDTKLEDVAERGDEPATMARLLGTLGSDFAGAMYAWTKQRFRQLRPSLVVADMFYAFLADACDELGIAYVATTSGLVPGMAETPWTRPLYSQDGHPTTLRLSLAARLHAAVIEPAVMLCAAFPALREAARVRRALGVTAPRAGQASPADRFRGRLTLVNTFFGHETPRPLPAHVRLIGPVRSHGAASAAQRLEGRFAEFVGAAAARRRESSGVSISNDGTSRTNGAASEHLQPRLVLLSFGQNCSLSAERLRALLGGLRLLLAQNLIDGAVWSVSMTPEERLAEAGLRDPALTPPDLILVDRWVPQKALLEHPSVRVFVSHGGTESSSECFFAGKPVLSVPHFSDQPHNSRLIEEAGAGIVLLKRTLTPERVANALARVVGEPSFAAAARRLRALAVASGRLSTERAADELEYVLHHGDGHLQPQGDAMGWMKRNNVDLYLAVAAIGAGAVAAAAGAVAVVARRRQQA